MTGAERSNMITNAKQVVLERPNLRAWIVHILVPALLAMGHIAREVEAANRENDVILRLVPEDAVLGRETLQLDNDNRR